MDKYKTNKNNPKKCAHGQNRSNVVHFGKKTDSHSAQTTHKPESHDQALNKVIDRANAIDW